MPSLTLKRRLRPLVDRLARYSGLLASAERAMLRGVSILTYHRVLPDDQCRDYPHPALAMPLSVFVRELEWLAGHCRVMPIREALQLALPQDDPRPVICLSFDDGHWDNYRHAAPALDAASVRGTFFVTAGPVGTGDMLWFDRAALQYRRLSADERAAQDLSTLPAWMQMLKRCTPDERQAILQRHPVEPDPFYRLMSPDELRDLHRRGHEIASHTMTHPILTQLDPAQLRRELTDSRQRLGEIVGAPVHGFCYPNGNADDAVATAVREADYSYATTTAPGINLPGGDLFRLHRIDMNPQRVTRAGGAFDLLAFRAEISLLHERWR